MGAKFSYSSLRVEDQAQVPYFEAVGLKESEVGQIYAVYSQWINNSVNTLTLNDLMNKLHVKVTPFTRKIFDSEHANAALDNIPFYKFTLGLWNFCTLDDSDMVTYIFNMYDGEGDNNGDNDGEGVLDMMTCKAMIKHMYGDLTFYDTSPGSESCINSLKEKRPNGEYVDVEFLKKFSNECPAFLSPALILKTLCMEVTTGSRFWEKKLRERKEAQNQSYVSKDTLVKRASRRMINNEPSPNQEKENRKSGKISSKMSFFGGGGGDRNPATRENEVKHVQYESSHSSVEPDAYGFGNGGRSPPPQTVSDDKGTILDQISNLFGKRSKPPDNQPLSAAAKRAKKQKPISISRVSSRTLTYGAPPTVLQATPTGVRKPAQSRKIHVYGFYNEDGSVMQSEAY